MILPMPQLGLVLGLKTKLLTLFDRCGRKTILRGSEDLWFDKIVIIHPCSYQYG